MIVRRIRQHWLCALKGIAAAAQILPIVLITLGIFAPCLSGFVSDSACTISRQQQQQKRHDICELSMVAKSGGKLVRDEKDFATFVLDSESSRPVMVFFTAPWCGPCRLSTPVVKKVLNEYSDQMDVVEVCTDDLPEVSADSGVVSIPTIQMYFQGQLVDTIVGCVAKNVLASAVDKVLEEALESAPKAQEETDSVE